MNLNWPRKQRRLTQLLQLHLLRLLQPLLLRRPLPLRLLRLQLMQPWQRFGWSFQEQHRLILQRRVGQIPEVVLRHLLRHQVLGWQLVRLDQK